MKSNKQRITEIAALLNVIQARLEAPPRDKEDWQVIRSQLVQAANKATTAWELAPVKKESM